VPLTTFDTSLGGWDIVDYSTPTAATAAFDGTVGQPLPGSAVLTIPFVPNPDSANSNEQVNFGATFAPLNLAGKTLSVRVKLDSGLSPDGGAAKLTFYSAGHLYAEGGFQLLPVGEWVTLSVALDDPDSPDPAYTATQIVEVDVEIQANGPGPFTTATIHVDTPGYQ
jgi:hypothetical protein